uniref:Leprecan-like alpha-helical domain-containing protein n=1 Tax=Knipowitschia caucasica TaxID=637954 RepID=A0AAV2MBX7_KNICA
MAQRSLHFPAYVAHQIFLFVLFDSVAIIHAGSGLSGLLGSHLQPYDFFYYSGVRAYFEGEWVKAAEHLEKSLLTKDLLFKVRRQCYEECETAGANAFHNLDGAQGNLWDLWALDWVQQKAECMKFCLGNSVSSAALQPVSSDIEYEFSYRNPYNFLQVTYYKLEKLQKAASAAHTYFVANPSHLEMRNNIEKYRRMDGVTADDFQDREAGHEKHWVLYDSALQLEASADWAATVEKWGECVSETLRQTEECRIQCETASQLLPLDRGEEGGIHGAFEKAAARWSGASDPSSTVTCLDLLKALWPGGQDHHHQDSGHGPEPCGRPDSAPGSVSNILQRGWQPPLPSSQLVGVGCFGGRLPGPSALGTNPPNLQSEDKSKVPQLRRDTAQSSLCSSLSA